MIKVWDFSPISYKRDRTFNLYAKIDDHANDVHDYLKYLKFGYGRATDDASTEIRHGRMTREEGLEMVRQYDGVEPSSLDFYCDFLGISKEHFYNQVGSQRDPNIWKQDNTKWYVQDASWKHEIGEKEDSVRVPQVSDRTFGENNRNLYYNPDYLPEKKEDQRMNYPSKSFKVL